MRRLLLFGLLFVVFVALTAPLERYLTPWLGGALGRFGVALELKTLRLALPAGIQATDLRLSNGSFSLDLDSLYIGIMRSFVARGCGGARIDGRATSDGVDLRLANLNPSRCVKLGRLTLAGTFDGAVSLSGISLLNPTFGDQTRVHVELRTNGGTIGGYAPAGPQGQTGEVPIGEWEFQQAVLDAAYRDGKLEVREGLARTDGVVWELLGASLPPRHGDELEVRVDFRARIEEDSPRAKALLGLMPKAGEDVGGWRHFRVVGPLASMKLIGLQ